MKKLLFSLVISLFIFSNCFAQFKKGDFEFSFTGAFSSMTINNTSTGSFNTQSNSETRTTAGISFSPGYYLIDNFSIEAEIGISAVQKMQPSQYVLVNLSYTYLLPESKTALFAHAGYGLSNSVAISYLNNAISLASDNFDVRVLNFGAGIKYLISSTVLLHTEVNYRNHSWTNDYGYLGYSNYKVDNKISNVSVLFGFSILI